MITLADRYELGDKIGTGGMGNVYRAEDILTGNTVAIKALKESLINDDPTVLHRFLREADALRQLAHPNIVKILDSFEHEKQHFIVMEYLPGGSLRDRVKKNGPLPVEEAVAICLELADALTRSHHLGIIHRDIKPANVLLADDKTPRLTDFGLAQMSQASMVTSGSVVMGTIPYLSPEALDGEPQDTRADIWAFGVMLYELLAGIRPFRGDQTAQLIKAIVMQAPEPDLESLRPDVPAVLITLISHMLEKDPNQRIASARKIGAALEDIKREQEGDTVYVSTTIRATRTLPVVPTSFIGRDTEINEIINLVTTPDCRLITLTGPGGIGKTRLAIEAADHIPDDTFANGIRFVDLSPVQTVENIVPTIATAAGYQFPQSEDPDGGGGIVSSNEDQLIDYFSQKTMLLVVDNAEHLPDSVFLIERILSEAPAVKILVTSRVPLNSHWERIYPVVGLPVDDEAMDLFADRALRVEPRFDLQSEMTFVTSICQLMEGMPLGLELAATWMRVMSCRELMEHLSTDAGFLESRQRTVDQRHASLQTVFEHSWRLLTDLERDGLMRMSVFNGSFTREAARQVTEAGLSILTALVDQSLVQVTPEGRYRLHELVRQLSAGKLADIPDAERDTLNAHADYYSHFIEQQLPRLKSEQMPEALQAIEVDIDNVRDAWNHAIAVNDVIPIQRMAESLHHYFVLRMYHSEGVNLYQVAIDAFSKEDIIYYLKIYQSKFYEIAQQYDKRDEVVADVFDHIRTMDDLALKAAAFERMGHGTRMAGGDVRQGIRYLEQALSLFEALGDPHDIANILRSLAYAHGNSDDDKTFAYLQNSLKMALKSGNQWQLAHTLRFLGDFERLTGRIEAAIEYFQQGLEYAQQFNHSGFMIECLLGMARTNLWNFSNYPEARRLVEKTISIAREAGDKRRIMQCLTLQGFIAHKTHQQEMLEKYWVEANELATQLGDDFALQGSLYRLAVLESNKGNIAKSIHYSEQFIEISRRVGNYVNISDRYWSLSYGAFIVGRYVEGKRYAEQGFEIWDSLPDVNRPLLLAAGHLNMAHNILELGERRAALEHYRTSYDLQADNQGMTHEIMAGIAKAIAYAGDLKTAIKLLRFILNADKMGEHYPIAQRDYDDLIAELPENVVEGLLAEADLLTHDEAGEMMLNHPIWQEYDLDPPSAQA